jgi:hypothetical protein
MRFDQRGMFIMVVFAWIGEIILFFLCWRIALWGMRRVKMSYTDTSIWIDMFLNLAMAILLLLVLGLVHNIWWLVLLVGLFVGAFSAQVSPK